MITPLYARYIPPKTTHRTVGSPPVAHVEGETSLDPLKPDDKKRKRDITDDAGPRVPKSKKSRSIKDRHVPSESRSSRKETRANGFSVDGEAEVVNSKPTLKPLNGHTGNENGEEPIAHDRYGSTYPTTNTKEMEVSGKKRKHKTRREVGEKSSAPHTVELELENEHEKEKHNRKHSKIMAKFEKSGKATVTGQKSRAETVEEQQEKHELHDLVPIPLLKQYGEVETLPTFSTLPQWLAKPVVVSSDTTATFEALGLQRNLVEHLKSEGYTKALPVQTGVLPLLLPFEMQHPGDLCISAATGSGKTLAYVLPLVQILKARVVTKLRAVIIVPTRELVTQVRDTADLCAAGTDLKIGIAIGSQSLKTEQQALVKRGRKFDPDGYKVFQRRVTLPFQDNSDDTEDDSEVSTLADATDILPGHVPHFASKVDILVCTPGRLVDHIRSTKGFTLGNLDWLVIDEADRLLDQSFQDWADSLMKSLESCMAKTIPLRFTDDPLLSGMLYPWRPRHVRKVVLSATMTRDLDKLSTLKLWNPKLVIVGGPETHGDSLVNTYQPSGAMSLPLTLQEYALPVEDGTDKPLYLLQLLLEIFAKTPPQTTNREMRSRSIGTRRPSVPVIERGDSMESEITSNSSSDIDSDISSVVSSSSSSSSTLSNASTYSSSRSLAVPSTPDSPSHRTSPQPLPSALIFTSSNESAHRLLHILTHLHPPFKPLVAALTKSTTSSQTAHCLSSFRSSAVRLLIATDRASRGLDLPDLDNVISYDIPRSISSYVHRVGRTARAGKEGKAWTLVDGREAAWFWKVVARGEEINRGSRKVERVRVGVDVFGENMRMKYAEALERLKRDVEKKDGR